MKLNITPSELGKMFFYDILLLYGAYEDYVNEETENREKFEEERQAQYESANSQIPDYSSMMPKMPEIKIPEIKIPNFNY